MTRLLTPQLGLLLALAVGAIAGCKTNVAAPPDGAASAVAAVPSIGEYFPPSIPVADYVGAHACAECHPAIYEAWSKSPHGRSMMPASPQSVLANFDAGAMTLPDGTVAFSQSADGYFIDMESHGRRDRRKVDLVLASGRQHQLYAVRGGDGAISLLPVVWSTKTKEWLPLSLYQRSDLSPDSTGYWGAKNLSVGCATCHVSQAYRHVSGGVVEDTAVDLSINCESCHGPGREHVRRRRAGVTDEVYRDLRSLSSAEESRVCGQCHGFQLKRYVFPPAPDGLPQIFVTSLVQDSLRADATQRFTSYQYPGHVLTAGFARNLLRCKDCHAPHGLEARDKNGLSAVGADSNKQCTDCHEELAQPTAVTKHSNHAANIRCVDCHMPYSWIGDDETRHQRTSDHSIAVPHPRETLEVGTPNACNTCHRGRTPEWSIAALTKWGDKDALVARDWVKTIAAGRAVAPGATDKLVALLTARKTGSYLKASALDLLVIQPPDARIVPSLVPFATDEDPNLRAIAIRALDVHDAQGRAHWRSLGLSDAHPYVRMETFSLVKNVETLASADIDKNRDDVLAYMSPPTDGLIHLITVRHRRHEFREALALLDLFQRVSLPRERAALDVNMVRSRIEADIARGGASGSAVPPH
jgi:hypothetical protein